MSTHRKSFAHVSTQAYIYTPHYTYTYMREREIDVRVGKKYPDILNIPRTNNAAMATNQSVPYCSWAGPLLLGYSVTTELVYELYDYHIHSEYAANFTFNMEIILEWFKPLGEWFREYFMWVMSDKNIRQNVTCKMLIHIWS